MEGGIFILRKGKSLKHCKDLCNGTICICTCSTFSIVQCQAILKCFLLLTRFHLFLCHYTKRGAFRFALVHPKIFNFVTTKLEK